MNAILQSLVVLLTALVFIPSVVRADGAERLIPGVAQSILEGEGYRLFSFTADEAAPLQLTATLDGQSTKILDILSSKEVVLAIKLGKENLVEAIHVHFTGGSAIRKFGSGFHELSFTTVYFSNPIQEGTPFLTLRSKEHDLEFRLAKK